MKVALKIAGSFLILLGWFLLSCQSDQTAQEVKSEFRNIKPAPSNSTLQFTSIQESKKQLSTGEETLARGPLVRLLGERQSTRGKKTYKGKLSMESTNVLKLMPDDGSEITLDCALPESFQLRRLASTNGIITVDDNSSLDRNDVTVTIETGQELLLGYTWKVSDKPIRYNPINGVVIYQTALAELPTGNAMQSVEVSVNTSSGRKKITIGEDFDFSLGDKQYKAFVHTSLFQSSSDEGDDTPTAYILRAVVTEI